MDVTPLVKEGLQLIQSYSDTGFKITGTAHEGAVFVMSNETYHWHYTGAFQDLSINDLTELTKRKSEIDVFLIGTGKLMKPLPPEIMQFLLSENIYPDVMDTGAACRTFNVLVAEGRRVMAAILPNA